MLQLFHCANKKVVFTNTATESLNIILASHIIPEGSTVYISPFEHNAVTRTLHHLSETQNIAIVQLAVDSDTLCYDMREIIHQFQKTSPR